MILRICRIFNDNYDNLVAITDISELITYFTKMFPVFAAPADTNYNDFTKNIYLYGLLLVICIIFATGYPEKAIDKIRNTKIMPFIMVIIFWYCVYYLSLGLNNPFLYFRF